MELLLLQYGYRILFPLAVIEGPILTVLSGMLVHFGYFNIFITLSIITLADVLTDIWYRRIGTRANKSRRLQNYVAKSDFLNRHVKMMGHFRTTHIAKTMFLGKQAYGLSVPIIISAGMCSVPLRRFLLYSVPISCIQGCILLVIGYILGNSYYLASKYIAYPGLILLVIFMVIVLGYYKTTKYIAKNFEQQSETEDGL